MPRLTSNGSVTLGLAAWLILGAPAWSQEPVTSQASPSLLDPGKAAMYSIVLPGAGQVYAGEWLRGGMFMAVAGGLAALSVVGYLQKSEAFMQTGGVGLVLISVVAPIDAFALASALNAEKQAPPRKRRER